MKSTLTLLCLLSCGCGAVQEDAGSPRLWMGYVNNPVGFTIMVWNLPDGVKIHE